MRGFFLLPPLSNSPLLQYTGSMTIASRESPERKSPNTGVQQISGLIERVTFHSEESGFCVLRIKARGHHDQITVIGTLPQVRAGEWIEADGRWAVDRDHGQQFKAEVLRTTAPATAEGIERYLASGLIKGITALNPRSNLAQSPESPTGPLGAVSAMSL